MKRTRKIVVLSVLFAAAAVTLLLAQANYGGFKDVGAAMVTYKNICLEGSAGAGQDLCVARGSAGHITFLTGNGATNPDAVGSCTASAATTCVVTFTTAFTAAPNCVVTDQTTQTNGALKALPTTTTLTITTPASSSDKFSYMCFGS
jgi:hypothetical protein